MDYCSQRASLYVVGIRNKDSFPGRNHIVSTGATPADKQLTSFRRCVHRYDSFSGTEARFPYLTSYLTHSFSSGTVLKACYICV